MAVPVQKSMLEGFRERFRDFAVELELRGYSNKTIDIYLYYNGKFLDYVGKSPREVRTVDIRGYLHGMVLAGKKPRTVNMAQSSLKAYYGGFLRRRLFTFIRRQKTPRDLPRVFSPADIRELIDCTGNPKHRLLIELLYSSGLRAGECVRLRVIDIDTDGKMLFVENGKGKKDRHVITSARFIEDLRQYIAGRKRDSAYVFDSPRGGHITVRAAEEIVRASAMRVGISKRAYPHLFRASFATHLIEDDVSIYKVQKLLGHSDVRTTEGYIGSTTVDIRDVRSPMDSIA